MSKDQVLRELYDALNVKDVTAIKEHLTKGAVFHILPNPLAPATELDGRDAILAYLQELLAALDAQQTIDAIAVNGDFATVFAASESIGPDGVAMTVRWADTFRFEGDRIAEYVSLSG